MRCIDWGLALMVIEITKKHIIVAITCLAIGVAIGVGTVMLVNHESKNMSQTEITSAQVKLVEASKQETSTPTNQATNNSIDVSMYRNARFGFSVRYPSTWVRGQESTNGDGCIISPQDGTIEVTVSGSNNTLNETTQAAYYRTLNVAKQRGIPGFHTVSDDWYVVTYTDGTFIYYVKGFVGAGSENKLHIKYLQSKKDQYQDVVQQLENGFNHGNLDAGH
ncbi:hypothetical protein [Veillonella sp. T34266-5]|uniref:hypothetical protein n=1 Tax=Veillonella sp. T34266-5 TaxID=2027457 RepID=UPI001E63A4F1|nr:hypothetical protein [Veillonella sp. T34266-5]